MNPVYVEGRKLQVEPRQAVGKGGEADVYRIGPDLALKLWKTPDHPDFLGAREEQRAAKQRLDLYQGKMRAFPPSLPPRVIAPSAFATDRAGRRLLGYTMRFIADAEPLLRYGDRSFRARAAAGGDLVCRVFADLHATLGEVHRRSVVVGDFNDLNVLVRGPEAYFIDADSYQFAGFPCPVFTARSLDPLLCDPAATELVPARPFTPESDWYAFAVMLMQSLLFVGPYGGIHRPKAPGAAAPAHVRVLQRITVFHPEVRYPKPAAPWTILPDALLEHFRSVFERDRRGPFPEALLTAIPWRRCPSCGIEHARTSCPLCSVLIAVPGLAAGLAAGAAPPPATPTVHRGGLVVIELFHTAGRLLGAASLDGQLHWLEHRDGAYRREDGAVVLQGDPVPGVSFALRSAETLAASANRLLRLEPGRAPVALGVDTCGRIPAFAANARHIYRVEAGRLLKDGPYGPEPVGQVLPDQTRIFVGSTFGFGFYRAGTLSVAFVFDAERPGLNDSILLPELRGKLLQARCSFTDSRCFLFTAAEEKGRTVHRCTVVRSNGAVEATASGVKGDGGFLSSITPGCAAGSGFFTVTDDGIVRVDIHGRELAVTRRYPETEPYVDSECELLAARDGLAVISNQSIRLLKIC